MGDVLECVVFRRVAETEREHFVAAAAGIEEWAHAQPGFVSRELLEVGDGRWVDAVRRAAMGEALAAADATYSDACSRGFALIDMDAVELLHGTPALPAARA